MSDELAERMKSYESDQRLLPMIPVIARIDGRAFHSFCRGLKRPDERMNALMDQTMAYLVGETNARIGYVQSDEITLVYLAESYDSEIFFKGRVFKMISALSSMASVYFNSLLKDYIPEKVGSFPTFDCRVFNVPSKEEAVNNLIWRQIDATKNSIAMLAQANFSHGQLQGKSGNEMQEMLFQEKGINWNNCCYRFKRGVFARRILKSVKFSVDEISRLPEKHAARTNPDLLVERKVIEMCDLWLTKIKNRVGVAFDGETPIMGE